MSDYEDKRDTAISLLLQAGVLKICPIHEDEILEGGKDIEGAYKLASAAFKRGRFSEFENQREITDYILEVYGEYSDNECHLAGAD